MPVTVERVVDPADLPELSAIHQAAFAPYPTHQLLWRDADPAAERRWLATIFEGPLKKPDEPMFKAVDDEGRVLGFALWKVKSAGDKSHADEVEKTVPDMPEGADVELAKEFFGKLDNLRKAYSAEGAYIRAFFRRVCECALMAYFRLAQTSTRSSSRPTRSVRELDRLFSPGALLKPTSEACQRSSRRHRVRASLSKCSGRTLSHCPLADGLGLYQKFGFVRTQEDIVCGPNGVITVTPMRRPPQQSKQSAQITVHRVTNPAELPSLAPVHRDAFSPYTMHRLIWGKVLKEDDNRWMAKSLADSLANPREPLFKAVDERGEVVGFALWKVPPKDGEAEVNGAANDKPPEFAEGTNVELAKEFFDKLDVLRKTYGDDGPHIRAYLFVTEADAVLTPESSSTDLNILVVSPNAQRKGVGKALIQWGIDEADRLGIPAWLEASERASNRKPGFFFSLTPD